MKTENGYFLWNKTDPKEYLSDHFNTLEFNCKCKYDDCIEQRISEDLIARLQWLRFAAKCPLEINSAYRCAQYQKELEASNTSPVKTTSQHELGNAVDVHASSLIVTNFVPLVKMKFYWLGIGRNFVHMDTRPKPVPQEHVIWYY